MINNKNLIIVVLGICLFILMCASALTIVLFYENMPEKTDNRLLSPKVKETKLIKTNLNQVIDDFDKINEIDQIEGNIKGKTLEINIIQNEINTLELPHINISGYTDWSCQNIKNDIEILKINIKTPETNIKANLRLAKRINNDYFHEDYIKKCLVK